MIEKPVALITGASRGLGRAIATSFAKKGWAVAIHYNKGETEAKETQKTIQGLNVPCEIFQADVKKSKSVDAMISAVEKTWGKIDVLVNNAGVSRDRQLLKMSDEEWDDVIQTNLSGPFYCTRAVLPLMRKAKSGSIVNISSNLARKPSFGVANYAASKSAVISLTQSTALEMGRHKVRANAIIPGFHVTDMNSKYWEKYEKLIRDQHVLDDLPNKQDLGDFVFNIANLKTVTGQVFCFESRL